MRLVWALLLVAAAAAAGIVVNLSLLGYASSSNDPVGRLSPRARLPAAPAQVVRPQTGPLGGREADD
jgi:hypothetical protein